MFGNQHVCHPRGNIGGCAPVLQGIEAPGEKVAPRLCRRLAKTGRGIHERQGGHALGMARIKILHNHPAHR
jgi:hypothetical protein